MAYSPIEDKYLSALTAMQFPDEPVEVAMPEQTAPGRQPGDVLLAAGPSTTMTDAGPGVRTGRGGVQLRSPSMRDITEPAMGMADMLAATGKGLVQGFVGLPGEVEAISYGVKEIFNRGAGEGMLDAFLRGFQGGTILPKTEEVKKWLDQNVGTVGGGKVPYESIGEVVAPGGQIKAVKAGAAGVKALVRETGSQLDRAMMEGTGPLSGLVPPGARPMFAVDPGSVQLNRQEKAVISAGAGRKKQVREEATKLATDMKANYAEADGWAPIEINKVEQKLDKAGKFVKVEIEPKAISYDFHTPPADVPVEAWQATMSSRVLDEVQTVVDRAAAGDQAALDILAEASWYRTMRDRLRTEFGGIGDVFADVLGTTSAQTDVRQNFKNAVAVLTKFSRGDYDKTLAAYESRVAKGQPVDAKTLGELDAAGTFDLIKSDAGKLFNTNSPATMGALLDMFRAIKAGDSPKTPNFTGNLIGLTNEATIDVWAARMLRRLADLPRIPPPAEKGVGGAHTKGSTLFEPQVSGEFGFGQDVFREAADEINKSGIIKNIAPDIGDLGPDDLQAVAWFIEKEKWTNSGWTTKAGEGGSLDYEMSLAGAADPGRISELRKGINKSFQAPARRKGELEMGEQAYAYRMQPLRKQDLENKEAMRQELLQSKASVDRYTLGVSGERPDKPMSNYGQAELAAEFDDVVRNDPSVVTYNLSNTYGSFMGGTERALNAEFITKQNFVPTALERRMVEQGKAYDQDAVFISKVVKDSAAPNARPGVEIYFKEKITPEKMAAVTAKLREYGVDGFTYVTDMRFSDRINVQARAGGAETAGLNGLRFQYIPEFDDGFNQANRSAIMAEKQRLFDKVVEDMIGEGNVSDARTVFYDTKVYFRSDYDAYLGRTTQGASATPGSRSSSGADAPQPDNSGEVGKDFSRAVSDRLRKKAASSKPSAVNRGGTAPQSGAK